MPETDPHTALAAAIAAAIVVVLDYAIERAPVKGNNFVSLLVEIWKRLRQGPPPPTLPPPAVEVQP